MPKTELPTSFKSYCLLYVTLLLISGCGLGLSSQDRLERAQQAYLDEEYRAAIIDAKNVLQEEPQNVDARLLLGRASIRTGDAASAEIELRRAVELGTDPGNVVVDLGRALILLGRYEQIVEEVSTNLANSDDDQREIYMLRGEALVALDRPAEARDSFSSILESDSNHLDAQLGIVSSYVRERNYTQARATLDYVTESNSDSATPWLASGELAISTRNFARAVDDFSRALAISDERPVSENRKNALIGLVQAYLAQDDFVKAKETVDILDQVASESTQILFLKGRIAYGEENWREAEQAFLEVLSRNPDYQPAQTLLGAAHLKSGNLEQAEMYLSAVVASMPSNADARKLLAETRIRQGRTNEAQALIRPLIAGDSVDPNALTVAARASIESNNYDQAAEFLEERLADNPSDPDLKLDLAAAYLGAGRSQDAQEILDNLSDDSGSASYRGDLLRLLTRLAEGETEQALNDANALVDRWPTEPQLRVLVGNLQRSAGQLSNATENFEMAKKLMPSDVTPHLNFARLELARGDLEAARQQYLQALEIEPQNVQLLTQLAILAARDENRSETQDWLEKAQVADASAILPRLMLARLLISNRDFDAAITVANEGLQIDDSQPELHTVVGTAQQRKGDNNAALKSFERAVQADSNNPAYRVSLARAEMDAGLNDNALATLTRARQLSPRHIPTAVSMVSLRVERGDLQAALEVANDLNDMYPESEVPKALLGEVFAAEKDYSAAADAYDDALRIKSSSGLAIRAHQIRGMAGFADQDAPLLAYLGERPLDGQVRLVLARSYQTQGQSDEAIKEYQKVLVSTPENIIALNNTALLFLDKGDSRAVELSTKAYSLSPNNSSIADTYGWVQIKQGSPEAGIAALRQAVEIGGGRPEHRYHLGAGLVEAGQIAEARQILEEILADDHKFASRAEAEQLLRTL